MLRSLIRLYLLVVVFSSMAIGFVEIGFTQLFHTEITSIQRESIKPYAFVMESFIQTHPGSQRTAAMTALKQHGDDGFSVLARGTVPPGLQDEQLQDLREGKLVLSRDTKDYYLPLSDGTIIHAHPDWPDLHADFKYWAFAYILLGLAILASLFFWISHHWSDLRKLEATARAFGKGNLSRRIELPANSSIYDISCQFNEMAVQIESSIQHQRDMINGVAHELKTPLARLEFGLALLEKPDHPQGRKERQAALKRDVRELDELVTELLTLSRLDQQAVHLTRMEVAVNELIDNVAAYMTNEVTERSLSLSIIVNVEPMTHFCDPKLVTRAMLNLVRNSVRYARHAISISARKGSEDQLVLVVDDDGPGIPFADRARLFEPFYRLDASRDRHTGGHGLGLAIVKGIAQAHGGEIRVEESHLGGARFLMVLPVVYK